MNPTAKQTAIKIAKQLAQEPLEILETAREQVTGEELQRNADPDIHQDNAKLQNENIKLKQEYQSQRMLGALNQELNEIKRQNLFKELQQKIANGVEVYLEDQNELSSEQREVLKAQIEAVAIQKMNAQNANAKSASFFGSSKPSRRMGGQKQQAQKEQTRVEKPVPPSG